MQTIALVVAVLIGMFAMGFTGMRLRRMATGRRYGHYGALAWTCLLSGITIAFAAGKWL